MLFTLDIYNFTREKTDKNIFFDILKKAESYLIKERKIKKSKRFSLELSFVGERRMIFFNRRYHHKNRPTDVISISYFEPAMNDSFLGEIFICIPYARRQARQLGQSLREELKFLFLHGLLHLFGYDHKKPTEEHHMNSLIYRILGRI